MNICLHVACKYVYMKSLLLPSSFTEFKRFVLNVPVKCFKIGHIFEIPKTMM